MNIETEKTTYPVIAIAGHRSCRWPIPHVSRRFRLRPRSPAPPVCDTLGMNTFNNDEPKPLRTLPLYSTGAADANRLLHHQRLEIERRGEYAREQLARQRERGSAGTQLDPVLRFHLGLD